MVDYYSYIQGQEANRGLAEVGALLRGEYNDPSVQVISELEAKNNRMHHQEWRDIAMIRAMRTMLTVIAKNNPGAITKEVWAAFDEAYRSTMAKSPSSFDRNAASAEAQKLFEKITA